MPEEPTQEPRTVVVEGPTTGFRTEVQVAGHHLTVDEPVPVGGSDAGPSPYEMLLAALGSCTAMTLRLYADRRKWPLERAVVKLRHHKVHAKDCVDCAGAPGPARRRTAGQAGGDRRALSGAPDPGRHHPRQHHPRSVARR